MSAENRARRAATKRPVIIESSDEDTNKADDDADEFELPKAPVKRPAKRPKLETVKKEKAVRAPRKPAVKRVKPKPSQNGEPSTPSCSNNDFGDEEMDTKPPPKKSIAEHDDPEIQVLWDMAEVLATYQGVTIRVARNIKRLLDEDNTVPFIARYRRGLTDGMEAEQLCAVKEAYEELKLLQTKARTVLRQINQAGKMTPEVKNTVLSCQSLAELELVAAPYKPGSKGTLAERARSLGLEDAALTVLWGKGPPPNLFSLVQEGTAGLKNVEEVETGIQHIIADVVSKTREVLGCIRQLRLSEYLTLESRKARASAATKEAASKAVAAKQAAAKGKPMSKVNVPDEAKFTDYFQFNIPVRHAKPHQVLALNRGEKLKVLSIKVVVPDGFWYKLNNFCEQHFLSRGYNSPLRSQLCEKSFRDAWERLLQPLVCRQVRNELAQKAEKAGLEVFAENLKHLLLVPPLKGRTVLGIDPGFKHGCKLSVVSSSGDLLHAETIYPKLSSSDPVYDPAARVVQDVVHNFSVQVVALGNGTACREVEAWLGALISARWFGSADISYAVVNEQGASIYSCSPEAKEEFPKLDPNLISSVSIARRLQEPLAELVKLEPKHLGVGMYQHDVPDARLRSALDEVVQACVSFVGVDLNTASRFLLRRVAGLSDTRAKNILAWRSDHGHFISRQQLLQVKGIGAKTFEQCAGFIRIMAASITGKSSSGTIKSKSSDKATPLDSTNVHPESYGAAHQLLTASGAKLADLGDQQFISSIRAYANRKGIAALAEELKLPDEQAATQLVEALTQGLAYDPRASAQGPIFRRGMTSIEDLQSGTELSGCVRNVTHFGAFVDVGVGINGLLHVSAMRGTRLALGNRVNVRVTNLDIPRKRIGLELIELLS